MSKKKYFTIVILSLLILLIGVSNIQPVRAQFAIASWDFPDAYGQGIEGFEVFGNATGSWVQVGPYYTHDDTKVYEWNISVAIKIRCWTWFNSTLTGAVSGADGKNYQRHNVTVVNSIDSVVFTQQNFTYVSVDTGIDPPMWLYGYECILEFLPLSGEYYTVTVIYEIFY